MLYPYSTSLERGVNITFSSYIVLEPLVPAAAMEPSEIVARFTPVAAVHATRECDAVVHKHGVNETLSAAFESHGGCRFLPADATRPLPWSEAVARLESALCTPESCVEDFINAYMKQLESCTAVAAHDYLASPLLLVAAAWVSQQNLTERLSELIESARHAHSAPLHVVLVAQRTSRQDDAASDPATTMCRDLEGIVAVHLLRLGDDTGDHTVASVANVLLSALHDELSTRTFALSETVNRLGRARRSTFSWLRGVPTAVPLPLISATELLKRSPSHSGSTGTPRRHRRRASFAGDAEDTPLFEAESFEAVARHLADMQMLSGRYNEAAKAYQNLVSDYHSLTGAGRIHAAAAQEMYALASALSGSLKREVARNLETAALAYIECGRPELSIRAALRFTSYCDDAAIASKCGDVLWHIASAIRVAPSTASSHSFLPTTPSSFLDAAAGVLHARAAIALAKSNKRRRAALNSFLSAARFSKLGMHSAAATVVRTSHPSALDWPGVQDEYDLILGQAEIADGSASRAAHHFTQILANASDEADVELQSFIVRQLSGASLKGAAESMRKRWDAGALFPGILMERAHVETVDSKGSRLAASRSSEDEILIDYEYFQKVRRAAAAGKPLPVRDRPQEAVIAELRKKRDTATGETHGGSLENKIRKMRRQDTIVRKRRRACSLIERCAVVGERIEMKLTMKNPLHFPVFINNLAPVVTFNNKCCTSPYAWSDSEDATDFDEYLEEKIANGSNGIEQVRALRSRSSVSNDPIEFLTNEEIVLGPKSTQDVVLTIVVHAQGILRFIGAQWLFTIGVGDSRSRASSQIPGYSKLVRRGRRLNQTREHRSSQIPLYEEDKTLEVEITAPAPRISASLQFSSQNRNDDGRIWARAGELQKGLLSLTNDGATDADSITFRLDTPESLFLDTSELSSHLESADEYDATQMYLLDESGNFVSNGSAIVAGYTPVNIKSGDTLTLTAWFRASVAPEVLLEAYGKKRRLSKLTAAERKTQFSPPPECAYGITIAYGESRARICRCEGLLFVKPSIFVSRRFMLRADSSVVPDAEDDGTFGLILGVEAEHTSNSSQTPSEVPIYQIRSISITSSKRWQLAPLPSSVEPLSKDPNGINNRQSTLRINETATLFTALYLNEDDLIARNQDESWCTSVVNFDEDPLEPSDTNAAEDSVTAATKHFVLTNKTRTCLGAPKLANVCGENLTVVSIGWRNSEGTIGTLYLQPMDLQRWRRAAASVRPGSALQTRSSSFASLSGVGTPEQMADDSMDFLDRIATEAPPIFVSLRHKCQLTHDFQGRKMPAVVGVNVHVRNVSQRLIDVFVTAAPHGGIADGDRGRYWTGDIAVTMRAIPPDAERYLQLSAVLQAPGSYDMAQLSVRYQISLLKQSQRKIAFPLSPSYVQVNDVSSTENMVTLSDVDRVAELLKETAIEGANGSGFDDRIESEATTDQHLEVVDELLNETAAPKGVDESDTPTSVSEQARCDGAEGHEQL